MRLCPAARAIGVLSALICSGLFLSCGGGSIPQGEGGTAKLRQITIAPSNPAITKGASQQLAAMGSFDDGTQHALGASVTWQTSQPAVATINTQGNVTGVGEGVAQVSATYQGVRGATSVTVGQPGLLSITVSPNQSSLPAGESEQLTATGNFSDGSVQNLTQSATWSSSAPPVATINAAGLASSLIVGSTTIAAASGTVQGTAMLTVTSPVLASITVTPVNPSIAAGAPQQFTATGTYSDGSTQNLTNTAIWSSSAPAIASVSPAGEAVANAVGTATISATAGSMNGTASLTVTPAAVVALNIIPATSPIPIALGSSRQLQAIATLSDGTTQDMTGIVTWSSMQPDIASVSSGGLAIAEQVGSTTILAEGSGLTGSANLTVVPLISVNYFDLASVQQSGYDGTIRLTNPGLTNGNLCAMVYVFDQNQELNECCGCTVSDSGLRSLSLLLDLTANPLTGTKPQTGVIKVVPSDLGQNPQCDPGSLAPAGVILGWGSNVQVLSDGTFQVTETKFKMAPLNDGETTNLVSECNFLKQAGSGKGICSCGSGD
jgi:Bacterial Ig-like domain (group 2)